ncbi:MAG: hypothetical protein D8M59_08495 [Planctomycetes bacterium]|nr:hypothetical protein [Planctomycetota bacterium]NOG53965.1 hypothetical protein [Planctomycetota bacterium]
MGQNTHPWRRVAGLCAAALATTCLAATVQADEWLVDFESGIPGDWQTVDYWGSSPFQWNTDDPGSHGNLTGGSGLYAIADSGRDFGAYDVGLLTAGFDVTAQSMLSYDTDYKHYRGGEKADVDISVNGGSDWTTLLSWGEDHPGPVHVELALGDYAGQSAMIRFHYVDTYSFAFNWYWELDNVTHSIPAPASAALLIPCVLGLTQRRRRA